MENAVRILKELVDSSGNIVFFGGAGVSTESGIPDFRSVDGLYSQKYAYPPEVMLSHSFFESRPEEFFRFYREKMIITSAQPNAAHLKLSQWEREGKLRAVVTQNIDGLHQAAGSRTVYELHGSVHRNYCVKCGKKYDLDYVIHAADTVPRCICGGVVRPDVVLYEEALDGEVMQKAARAISQADLLIVGGTSLVVYPAAGLIRYYSGNKLVIINKTPALSDRGADHILEGKIGEILSQV